MVDFLLIVTLIVRVCYCSMFCCTLLYVHSSFAIILMGKRKQNAMLSLSSCCFLMVVWLFLVVPSVCLMFVIVVFPDHTHLLFLGSENPLYLLYMNTRLVTLKHAFHHWIVSEYELEMPLTSTPTVVEFDHEIISQ